MTSFLVVDDSRPLRQDMIEAITSLGFTDIREAINGHDALDKVENKMPGVITLDWNMPLMDGLQFVKILRTLPGGDIPKVIFCSSEGRHSKIKTAFQHGANEYIVKPVSTESLRERLLLMEVIK